jgi:hypothetical protein
MIEKGRMEASRIVAGAGTGNVLDQLQQASVLIPVNGDRDVTFRHHILFDYMASRVAIDLSDLATTKRMFKAKGTSLLLAPALSFALQHLWETSQLGRARFWEVVAEFGGDSGADPVARSVAARAGCDLPATAGDIAGLIELMEQSPSQREKAFAVFRHVVSSLTVRLEDVTGVPPEPWCAAAAGVTPFLNETAWPLRTLLQSLVDRVEDDGLRGQLGTAARALMDYSFTAEGGDMLMALAIGFVGKTFATDPEASRRLVERLLVPERMAAHAHVDMCWLAEEAGRVAVADPELAVEIYDRIFSHTIEEDAPTRLGQSRILALTSNRRQEFTMAQWRLKEAFPAFVREHPLEAVDAAVKVAGAYVATTHPLSEPAETVTVRAGGREVKLTADWSYIWAAQHQEAHADDAQQIVDSLVEMLRQVSETDVVPIAERVIAQNEFAWLWNRLFMVAAERGGGLAAFMWPWASQIEFLQSADTMKPAMRLAAVQLGRQPKEERAAFERSVLEADFPKSSKPAETRLYFQQKVFGAIGSDVLVTSEAKAIVDDAVGTGNVITSEDEEHFFGTHWVAREDFSWLRKQGVDVDLPYNASILSAITTCENAFSHAESASPADLPGVVELRHLLLQPRLDAHPMVIAHGWEKIAWAIERIAHQRNIVLALTSGERKDIEDILLAMSGALASLTEASIADMVTHAKGSTAGAMMNMVRASPKNGALFKSRIEELASDDSSDVRAEIAVKLGYLWKHDREFLWSLAQCLAETETNTRVLVHLVNFCIQAMNNEPDRIGRFVQVLLNRQGLEESENLRELRKGLGTVIFHLWVRHGRATARTVIDAWLRARAKHNVELQHAAFSIRDALVVGYDDDDPVEAATRKRAQALAFEIIDHTAAAIEAYFAVDPQVRTEDHSRQVSEDAALLEQMSGQFFFAAGVPETRKGREPGPVGKVDYRQRFLEDNQGTFKRVGDAATPKPVYYMLQLLEFLEPANPAAVFDLAAHALLSAGKLHRYQYESLGADQFVRMIGRTIADHRELFDDTNRRVALVEVLEVFVDAGWPGARRLLYRLPEALR